MAIMHFLKAKRLLLDRSTHKKITHREPFKKKITVKGVFS
jgi:hypothetical protein